jgi:hypothetical protein
MKIDLKSNKLLTFGLGSLVLANTTHFIFARDLHLNEDTSDFVFGCLMGLSFGALILSIIVRQKRSA